MAAGLAAPRLGDRRPGLVPVWVWSALAALPLVLADALPEGPRWLAVLAVVIVLGVPHGALDSEVVRPWMRRRIGRHGWFLVFGIPYLALSALVLLAWRAAPEPTLAAFFAVSVWHFGSEDATGGGALEWLARGALPIALPILLHPDGFARVFSVVAGLPMPAPPAWAVASAWAWLGVAAAWTWQAVREGRWQSLAELGLLTGAFVVLPPLNAFALYFVCLHAPRHMLALARDRHLAPRVASFGDAIRYALPVAALTFALGACLWPLYPGSPPERLLALTIQGLSALTLPHILLDLLTARLARRTPAVTMPAAS